MKGFKIEYTIDNFSEIRLVDDFLKHYIEINKYHFIERKKKGLKTYMPVKLKCVYFLYNKNKEIIYIGKTTRCLRARLANHLIQNPTEYEHDKSYNERLYNKRKEVVYFSWCEVKEQDAISILEIALIKKYKPKYNVEFLKQGY